MYKNYTNSNMNASCKSTNSVYQAAVYHEYIYHKKESHCLLFSPILDYI